MNVGSLQDVLTHQLADLYSAEQQLVEALPKVAKAADSQQLQQAVEKHLKETQEHVQRLEMVFGQVGENVEEEHCKAMEGLLAEGEEIMSAGGDPAAKDAALIAAAQKVEHYEISGYGTARTLAEQLGHKQARNLLEQTLKEESNADEKLTEVAMKINAKAA